MKKLSIVFCVLLTLCTLLQGCPSSFVRNNHPSRQPGTTWKTDDDKIRFYVDPNDSMSPPYGTIETENGTEEIVILASILTTVVDIIKADDYSKDSVDPIVYFARGHGTTRGKNEYVIEITEASEIFKSGDILIFHKVDQ